MTVMRLFEKIETYVIAILRIALVAVGVLAIVATVGLLVCAAWIVMVPSEVDHREFLTAPSYDELRTELLPTSNPDSFPDRNSKNSFAETESQQANSPYHDRLSNVTLTLDKQYNIAGRDEEKFSEKMSASYLERMLIEQGLAENFDLEEVADDYLIALQSLATDIAGDEVLSRIADTSARSSIIVQALNEFHDEYVLRLQKSYDAASSLNLQQNAAQVVTLQLLLWGIAVGFTLFLMVSLVLLVLRIERHLGKSNENREASAG